jgi:hypothetical protein
MAQGEVSLAHECRVGLIEQTSANGDVQPAGTHQPAERELTEWELADVVELDVERSFWQQ